MTESFVSQPLLDEIRRRASQARLPFCLIPAILRPLQRGYFSFFQSVGYTERPDTAAQKYARKIVLMANGSPFACSFLIFFSENFSSMDDYSEKAYFATLVRCLKYAAFLIAVMLQGVFVSIANSRFGTAAQNALQNSGQRTGYTASAFSGGHSGHLPWKSCGKRACASKAYRPFCQPCGGAYCGDTAVSAGLVGTPVVIVAALTAICTFVVPSLYEPITVLRLLFILAGGLLGPLGIAGMFFCMLVSASGMHAFGIPYLAPIAPSPAVSLRTASFALRPLAG